MKKYIIILCVAAVSISFTACNNKDDIDTGNSIFQKPSDTEKNEFDKWLMSNYATPYNVAVKYRLDDIETDVQYNLVPARYENAIALMKIVKHVWFSAYDELWGINKTRLYVPKLLHLIGNVAYTDSGMILGQAEGGLKVTLFKVNDINIEEPNMAMLNEYYFKTMHHEFAHILNQKKPYSTDYELISKSDYVGASWYQTSNSNANKKGFVSNYSMDRASEDFVEVIAVYVTNTPEAWNALLTTAAATGKPIIEKKFEIVYKYMLQEWGVDLNQLRDIVLRRQNEIKMLDLTTL